MEDKARTAEIHPQQEPREDSPNPPGHWNAFLQTALQTVGDSVIIADSAGRIAYLNSHAEALTGWSMSQAQGQPVQAVVTASETRPPDAPASDISAPPQDSPALEDRQALALDASDVVTAPVVQDGRTIGQVLVLHDSSRVHALSRQLSYHAAHDMLTGLPNRQEFERRLQRALEASWEQGQQHALCYLDLDQFKVVNDTCGHVAGDELLRQIAALLLTQIRAADTLARLGGDEFGLLFSNCPLEKARQIAGRIRQAIAGYRFVWQEKSFAVRVSMGMAAITRESVSLTEALSAVDTACFAAKEKGRNRIQVFRPGDVELAHHQGQMEWVHRIHRALEQDSLRLYAQKIQPLQPGSGQAERCEILLRMVDEQGQLALPQAFLPAAERYSLMASLDRWVIRSTFAAFRQSREEKGAFPGYACAINLSGESLNTDNLLEFIQEQFAEFGVPPDAICFEITETAAVTSSARAIRLMNALKAQGCRFALDDFGIGLSSFGYLKSLPVDYIKIDGSFVRDIVCDPVSSAMVESIHQIGHLMGIQTIAEFVENEEIKARLQEIGVDFVQGYAIARPMPWEPARKA